jgi:hypothetical protein
MLRSPSLTIAAPAAAWPGSAWAMRCLDGKSCLGPSFFAAAGVAEAQGDTEKGYCMHGELKAAGLLMPRQYIMSHKECSGDFLGTGICDGGRQLEAPSHPPCKPPLLPHPEPLPDMLARWTLPSPVPHHFWGR